MRIDILGTRGFPSSYGGFETLVRHLAPYLVERGHEVSVFDRQKTRGVGSHRPPVVQGVHVLASRGLKGTSTATLSHGLTSTLSATRRRPDVALIMNVANGFFLPALKMRGIPSVLNVDGIEWERDKWSLTGQKVFYQAARMTAHWADGLVSDSQAIRHRWQQEFSRDSYFVPYGGDPEVEPSSTFLEKMGLAVESFVLIVARFVPENNVSTMLDAATSSKIPVVVVGSATGTPLEAQIRARHDPPRVHILGHMSEQRDLAALWAGCGVYLHGHSVGGTNPALVQAMGFGAPVLALDTPYNREVLDSSEQLVTKDVATIAARLTATMSSSATRARFRANGISRVASIYNWPAVCAAYEDVMTEVVANKAARGLNIQSNNSPTE